jgi:hypothetical protein
VGSSPTRGIDVWGCVDNSLPTGWSPVQVSSYHSFRLVMNTNAPQGLISGRKKKVLGSNPCRLSWLGSFVIFLSVVTSSSEACIESQWELFWALCINVFSKYNHQTECFVTRINVDILSCFENVQLVPKLCRRRSVAARRKFSNFNYEELFQLNLTLISVPHCSTLLDCARGWQQLP